MIEELFILVLHDDTLGAAYRVDVAAWLDAVSVADVMFAVI